MESPHVHADSDEVWYVLDGTMEVLLGDRIEVAQQGALVFIPRGTVHAIRVLDGNARALDLHTPAGFERSVTALGGPATERSLPPPAWTAPAIPQAQRDRLFAELGVTWLAVSDPFRAGAGATSTTGDGA